MPETLPPPDADGPNPQDEAQRAIREAERIMSQGNSTTETNQVETLPTAIEYCTRLATGILDITENTLNSTRHGNFSPDLISAGNITMTRDGDYIIFHNGEPQDNEKIRSIYISRATEGTSKTAIELGMPEATLVDIVGPHTDISTREKIKKLGHFVQRTTYFLKDGKIAKAVTIPDRIEDSRRDFIELYDSNIQASYKQSGLKIVESDVTQEDYSLLRKSLEANAQILGIETTKSENKTTSESAPPQNEPSTPVDLSAFNNAFKDTDISHLHPDGDEDTK